MPTGSSSSAGRKRAGGAGTDPSESSVATSNKRRATKPLAVEKKELTEELRERIDALVETETSDKVYEELKAACRDVNAIDPNFVWDKFHVNKPFDAKTLGFEGRDLDLVTSLGGRTAGMARSMGNMRQAINLQPIRKKAREDDSLLPATDPFADTPIQFNNKDLHTFDPNDLEKLSNDEAHAVIKLILLTLRHTAVGLNTLDPNRVFTISDGLQAVLVYMENRALQPESPLKLTEDEEAYIALAKDKFKTWKESATKWKKKKGSGA